MTPKKELIASVLATFQPLRNAEDHQKTDDRAQEDVAAEYARRGNCYDNGQICESGISNGIEECEPVAVAESESGDLRERLYQTYHIRPEATIAGRIGTNTSPTVFSACLKRASPLAAAAALTSSFVPA